MPPTAVLRENADQLRPTLTRNAGSFVGSRHFDIFDAVDLDDCYNAVGLPEKGQIWSPARPKVKARFFDPVYQPGPVPFYICKVQYREDTPTQYTADPDLIITTMSQNSTSMMVDRETRDVPNPKRLTNDKRGVPRMLTTLSFEVVQFFETLPDIEPYMLLSDEPKVNSDEVILQNFMNSGSSITVPIGQLLYAGFAIGYEQELFTIRHRLERLRSWKNHRPIEDANGNQRLDPVTSKGVFELADIYETAPFGGVVG